ncbi:MAG: GAF and ANTAR domain-containing protein [Actinomycetota bacterium]|nr:GAF and ANTAR domain-containing protein [Actinomycetota bacterium]
MSTDYSFAEFASIFADVERELAPLADSESVLRAITTIAVREVPGAEYAGITRARNGSFRTLAPTSHLVMSIDEIQYNLGSGPCVDAIVKDHAFLSGDLRTDDRWPDFGPLAFESAGVLSMFSSRLYLEDPNDHAVSLNMYSAAPDAFDERSQAVGLLLATHGALAVASAAAREHAENLRQALKSSRDIGVAMGVIMNQYKVTRDQAFDLLRIASQHNHRKLAEIAVEVGDTGLMPEIPTGRAQQPR